MARAPFQQGDLDSLCGVYSVINATVAAAAPIKRLREKDCLDLFRFLICTLNLEDDLTRVLISGCYYPVLSKLLKVTDCWLRDRHDLSLRYRRPFHNRTSPQPRDAVAMIRAHLGPGRRAAIVRVTGAHEHWTVVTSVGDRNGRRLHLADSSGGVYLNRRTLVSHCDNRATKLVARDSILIGILDPKETKRPGSTE
jgi:hypothetical protein